jgi:hypothetical protein
MATTHDSSDFAHDTASGQMHTATARKYTIIRFMLSSRIEQLKNKKTIYRTRHMVSAKFIQVSD